MTKRKETREDESVGVDEVIVAGLAQGMSYLDAGALAGVSAKTVQRRMAEPEFARQVAVARSDRARQITDRLGHLGVQALQVFGDAMGEEQPVGVRLAAAKASLQFFREYRAAGELEERMRELEVTTAQLLNLIAEAGR